MKACWDGTTLILGGLGGRAEIVSQRTGLHSTLVAFKDEIVSQTSQYSSGFQGQNCFTTDIGLLSTPVAFKDISLLHFRSQCRPRPESPENGSESHSCLLIGSTLRNNSHSMVLIVSPQSAVETSISGAGCGACPAQFQSVSHGLCVTPQNCMS